MHVAVLQAPGRKSPLQDASSASCLISCDTCCLPAALRLLPAALVAGGPAMLQEGFEPASFKSSRSQRAELKQQSLDYFLDEDEKEEANKASFHVKVGGQGWQRAAEQMACLPARVKHVDWVYLGQDAWHTPHTGLGSAAYRGSHAWPLAQCCLPALLLVTVCLS